MQCRGIGPHLAVRESLMGFLELGQEPGVYSRVTAGCLFETGVCLVKSGHLSKYEGHLRNVN